jgi:hypothetical protein
MDPGRRHGAVEQMMRRSACADAAPGAAHERAGDLGLHRGRLPVGRNVRPLRQHPLGIHERLGARRSAQRVAAHRRRQRGTAADERAAIEQAVAGRGLQVL